MQSLDLKSSEVSFPKRCIWCKAPPEREVSLGAFRGIDLLYVRWGYWCEIPAPVCRACWRRRWWLRLAWFVALPVAVMTPALVPLGVLSLLGREPGDVALVFMVFACVAALFYLRNREIELFQRLFSPVWVRQWVPRQDRVSLVFRDEALCRDVAALSGASAPDRA